MYHISTSHTLSTICIILGCTGVVHTVCMHTYIHTTRKFAHVHSQWQCIPGKGEWRHMILGSLADGYGNGSRVMGMNTVLMSLHTTYVCTWLWSHAVRAFIPAFSHARCSLGQQSCSRKCSQIGFLGTCTCIALTAEDTKNGPYTSLWKGMCCNFTHWWSHAQCSLSIRQICTIWSAA